MNWIPYPETWDKDVTRGKVSQKLKLKRIYIGRRMKKGKAAGPTSIVTEMLKAVQDVGVQWLTNMINRIIDEGRILGDWEESVIVPIYKERGFH